MSEENAVGVFLRLFNWVHFLLLSLIFKYCRMDCETTPSTVTHLLMKIWKLPLPTLIVSVHGGARDFELQPKIKPMIKNGLIKAAETTGAWIITNGLNCGASKEVGSAVKNAFRRNHRIPCVGIAAWGLVEGRDQLVGRDVSQFLALKIADW